MAKKSSRDLLSDLIVQFGGAPGSARIDRKDIRNQAIEIGRSIYRETMHGKIKLTENA